VMSSASYRQYRILDVVGRGGFGTVYRAELTASGGFSRQVAIKVLNRDTQDNQDLAKRLRDEARMLGLVRHRAIVQVDGLVMLDNRWAVVMEYVQGSDLFWLMDEAVPVGPALEVVAEVASALHVAWTAATPEGEPLKILHRDLKPSNILVTPHGEVKIVDFGGARGNFQQREAQTIDVAYGSPGYVAPERLEAIESPAGDIFSLGCVFLELLAAHHVDAGELRRKQHDRRIAKLEERASERAPAAAIELAKAMVAWEPDQRPTAREVEREARNIRSQVQDPWLSEWAEGAISRIPERDVEEDHDFSDSVLYEHVPDRPKPPSGEVRRSAASTLYPSEPIPRLSKEPTLPPELAPPPLPELGPTAAPRVDSRPVPLASRPRKVDPRAKTIMTGETPRLTPSDEASGWPMAVWFFLGLAVVVFGGGVIALGFAIFLAVAG
ncbi:MAG: serine/threonine-protein kinase, partial [Myxococcota bacterium]